MVPLLAIPVFDYRYVVCGDGGFLVSRLNNLSMFGFVLALGMVVDDGDRGGGER